MFSTFISTPGGLVLPGGGARILRHSLPGQIGVTVCCSAFTLDYSLYELLVYARSACLMMTSHMPVPLPHGFISRESLDSGLRD